MSASSLPLRALGRLRARPPFAAAGFLFFGCCFLPFFFFVSFAFFRRRVLGFPRFERERKARDSDDIEDPEEDEDDDDEEDEDEEDELLLPELELELELLELLELASESYTISASSLTMKPSSSA
jgi:hypothetical protein